jgi:tape measure domain-containing protein
MQVSSAGQSMSRLGVSMGTLNQRINALKAQREWIPAKNIEAIRSANNEIRSLEKQVSRLNSLNGGKLKSWAASAFNQMPFSNLISNPLVMAGAGAIASIKAGMTREKDTAVMETLLGSKEQAGDMMKDILSYAAKTPYSVSTSQDAAKTMLSFGLDAKKVMPSLRAIGDIAAGDSQRMESLTLAFSQMSSAGRLMGQDLLQMVNAGFNPLQEISKKTGKSLVSLKKEMEGGKISSKMVTDAFISATSEGGKFYNMTGKITQTTFGQFNMLKAQLMETLAGIGNKLLLLANSFLKFGNAILQSGDTIKKLTPVFVGLGTAIAFYQIKVRGAIVVERLHAVALKLTAAAGTKLANVIAFLKSKMGTLTIIASSIALVTTALIKLNHQQNYAKNKVAELAGNLGMQRRELNALFEQMKLTEPGSKRRISLIEEINKRYPGYLNNMKLEKASIDEITAAQKKANDELSKNIIIKSYNDLKEKQEKDLQNLEQKVFTKYNKKNYSDKDINDILTYLTAEVKQNQNGTETYMVSPEAYWNAVRIVGRPNTHAADFKDGIFGMFPSLDYQLQQLSKNNRDALKNLEAFAMAKYGINLNVLTSGDNKSDPNGLNDNLKSGLEEITSGGKSVKNFNITINGGFIPKVENHFASTNESPETAQDFMRRLSEALQRVINDLNYAA